MSDKENLSALVDNENIDAALLDQLGKDEALSSSWQHYHLIGDVIRGEAPDAIDLELSSAIAAAIALEPEHVAIKENIQESANDSSLYQRFVQPWLKVGGQFAIAASVAVMVITGVQFSNTGTPDVPSAEPSLNVMPFAGTVAPVSLNVEFPEQQKIKREFTDEEKVEQIRRINAFVLDHQLQKRIQQ